MSDKPVLGIWTWEQFYDTLAMAGVMAVGAFVTTIIYRAIDTYLKETRWWS